MLCLAAIVVVVTVDVLKKGRAATSGTVFEGITRLQGRTGTAGESMPAIVDRNPGIWPACEKKIKSDASD